MFGLGLRGEHDLCSPDLRQLRVSGGAPPSLRNWSAALRRLTDAPPLGRRFAGGAPAFPAPFLPFLSFASVVRRAGTFAFLLVRGRTGADLPFRRRRAGVIPRADFQHQRRRLHKTPCGFGVVRVETLGFSIGRRDTFLASDPIRRNGIRLSRRHRLLVKFKRGHVRLLRKRRSNGAGFLSSAAAVILSAFIFRAASVGRRLPRLLSLLRSTRFGQAAAAAAAAASAAAAAGGGGFGRRDRDVLVRFEFHRRFLFVHFPGANLGYVVKISPHF